VEHFGLGRYGDEFDPDADKKAFVEMERVLRPGGRLIFITAITNGRPAIAFNAQRIYNLDILHERCAGLTLVEERFYSQAMGRHCGYDEVTSEPSKAWDVYMGCWEKV